MTVEEIMKFVIKNGADGKGIQNRFLGNTKLYGECFLEFLDEPNFKLLNAGIESKNYEHAFEAAHALKGISGNLGLTELYKSICVLVDSLRAKEYKNIELEHEDVQMQFEKLKSLYVANR